MVNKKAQLKIQQMAFMLIAVTLLFVFVGLFVLGIKFSGLKQTVTDLNEENAMLLVSKLANSPEFSCGEAFTTFGKTDCIDADKAIILKDNKNYEGFWGVNEIKIKRIYPAQKNDVECTIENYPDCNIIKIYSDNSENRNYKSNFVSLCRKENFEGEIYDKCELAKLIISYEVAE